MKAQQSKSKQWSIILTTLLIITSCVYKFKDRYCRREVQEPIPEQALMYAIKQLGKPYVLGGQGPDEFDCSGIIICAYEDALNAQLSLMNKRNEIRDDVNMDELYRHNVRMLEKDEVTPGDIVFITKDKEKITHGGLFIGWKDDDTIEFLNASSFYDKVLIDTWPIHGTKRGQWFVGFGRLVLKRKV